MIPCPRCGSTTWKAIESGTWLASVDLSIENGLVIIEMDPMSAFMQEAISSVTLAYTCGSEVCDFSIEAARLEELGRQ